MKKTSIRIATIGGIVVLSAFAIALAQHDARKRDREPPQLASPAMQPAVPIPLAGGEGDWASGASELTKLVVRGNNDSLKAYGSEPSTSGDNPLRTGQGDSLQSSSVVPASGEIPVNESTPTSLPTFPSTPAWLAEEGEPASNTPASTSSLPTFPITSAAKPVDPPSNLGQELAPPVVGQPKNAVPAPSLPTAGMAAHPQTSTNEVGTLTDLKKDTPPSSNWAGQNLPSPSTLGAPLPTLPEAEASGLPTTNVVAPTGPSSTDWPATGENRARISGLPDNATEGGPTPTAIAAPQSSWPPPAAASASVAARPLAGPTSLVSNQPGSRYLDGSQNPILIIQKRAPEEIQVGKKATFVITVRNAGDATAHEVTVVDSVPRGVRFVESAPAVAPNGQGILAWSLGEMAAGEERTITLQIIPEVQGEVGSVASVHFAAQASVRTVATLPHLELQVETASDVLIGSRQQLSVTIKNSGTGVARGVRLEADIPELLKHESGESQLEAVLGDLRPNELRRITLEVTATQPGQSTCEIRATSEDGVNAQESVAVEVLSPQLVASIEGPRLRYLDRQATYQIKVKNVGTAAASNLDFIVHLPAGLKYNSANNRGTYDSDQHTVSWGLFELPAGETAPIELTVLPVELGPQAITFAATADLGIRAEAKGQVVVDGLAELAFTIGQDNGTIELGTSTTYSVQVTNVGSKPDKDVRLAVQFPSGSKLMAVDAQVNYQTQGNQIVFEPVAEMRNSDTFTYRFQLQHDQAGTQIVRTQLTSANWPVAVIKEEGTLVYNDQH